MQSDKIIEKIRTKLSESDPANRTLTNIYQFHFTDSEGQLIKSFVFDFKDLNIYEGNCSKPDAEVTISDEDFSMVGSRQTTFEDLLSEDKVKVEGDMEAFNRMVEKMRLCSKKE